MVKVERFNVTLNPELVEKAKGKVMGAKLSPILNSLLEAWVNNQEEIEKIVRKKTK